MSAEILSKILPMTSDIEPLFATMVTRVKKFKKTWQPKEKNRFVITDL